MTLLHVCSPKAAVALSDQFLIKCNLHAPRPSSTVVEIFYRKLETLDFDVLKTDSESRTCASTWKDVSELAQCYVDSTMASLLDKHAPLQRKVTT